MKQVLKKNVYQENVICKIYLRELLTNTAFISHNNKRKLQTSIQVENNGVYSDATK